MPLIGHWDGTVWSIVPGADIGSPFGLLADIKALSANNVWAVGAMGDTHKMLVEHWDGDSLVPNRQPQR